MHHTKPQEPYDKDKIPYTILTEEQIAQIESLSAVLSIKQIAEYFGINPNELDKMKDHDNRIYIAHKKGKAKAIERVGNNLIKNAMNGDITATIFYLKMHAGWSEEKDVKRGKEEELS